jgi:hypothetical protein
VSDPYSRGPDGSVAYILNIAHAKESLFGLGSRFRVTPEEYDLFFRPFSKNIITEEEFSNLVYSHENDLLKQGGIQYEDEPVHIQSMVEVIEELEEEATIAAQPLVY